MSDIKNIKSIEEINICNFENEQDLVECTASCTIINQYIERITYLENLVKKYKFDHLTGLMMRQDFNDSFDRIFEESRFSDHNFTLAILDIIGLHNINLTKGMHAGDELILGVVNQLKEKFDFHQIFRIGGDEFAIIVRDTTMTTDEVNEKLSSIDNIKYIAKSSEFFSSPKHMIKSIDKELSKLKLKSREKRL